MQVIVSIFVLLVWAEHLIITVLNLIFCLKLAGAVFSDPVSHQGASFSFAHWEKDHRASFSTQSFILSDTCLLSALNKPKSNLMAVHEVMSSTGRDVSIFQANLPCCSTCPGCHIPKLLGQVQLCSSCSPVWIPCLNPHSSLEPFHEKSFPSSCDNKFVRLW